MNDHAARGRDPEPRHAVLLPGDLLPYREQWQPYAASLPANAVLLVVPDHDTRLRAILDQVAAQFAAAGRPVARLRADQLGPLRGIQMALPLP